MRTSPRASGAVKALVMAWVFVVSVGIGWVAHYKGTPSDPGNAPETWPEDSVVHRATDRSTLVMLAHPRCPCTRASVGELAELMQRAGDRISAYVLFLHPDGLPENWEKTDAWNSAAAIPGVHVLTDPDGVEARRFGAASSGQTVVYDAKGRLVFHGGITPARGHAGTSVGRDQIASLVLGSEQRQAPVFGCAMTDPETAEKP